jgi:hypothetical protein
MVDLRELARAKLRENPTGLDLIDGLERRGFAFRLIGSTFTVKPPDGCALSERDEAMLWERRGEVFSALADRFIRRCSKR